MDGLAQMKIPKSIFYVAALNIAVLAGVAFTRSYNHQLAYEIGSIYAGAVIGTGFTFLVLSIIDLSELSPIEILRNATRNLGTRGSGSGCTVTIGTSALLGIMAIVGDNKFFGHSFGANPNTTVIGVAILGVYYAMILGTMSMWFDYWIWRGKLFDYAIALSGTLFVLYVVAVLSSVFLRTPFFAVGIGSRAISSIIVQKWHYKADKGITFGFAISILAILLVSFVLGR